MAAPSRNEIKQAAERIKGYVHRTPVMDVSIPGMSAPVALKLENTQLTGSFKVRGAFNTLLSSDVPAAGVVAASGGNHGAAVAFAARQLNVPAKIFVPEMAGPSKIALIRATGADLVVVPGVYAEALAAAREHEDRTGAMQIHAYDAPKTLAGQGTLMAEWEDQGLNADTVLIAVGGGGLIGGSLAWTEGRRKIIGIEPELAPTLATALEQDPDATVQVGGIAANALGASQIGQLCYGLAKEQGIQSLLVPDDAIADAQRLLWDLCRQWIEPGGATALAALTSGAYQPARDEKVAVLVCGANPTPGPFV